MSLPNEVSTEETVFGRCLLDFARQRFPERAALTGPQSPGRDARTLEAAIENSLRPRMALHLEPGKYGTHDSLMDDYSKSVAVLRQAAKDVQGLFTRLWRLNVRHVSKDDFVKQVEDAFSKDYYGSMVSVAVDCVASPVGALSARLEAVPVEVAEEELRGRLDQHLEKFVADVKDLFRRMERLELIGRIDWATDTACDAFYFEDVIIHERGETKTFYGLSEEMEPDYDLGTRRMRQETLDVTKTHHAVRHGIHLKVLGKARENRLEGFGGVVPKEISGYLQATPSWLHGLVRIVDGKTRFDNLVDIEIDLAERKVGEPKVRQWELPAYCPLVTIADYVLTGWGNREEAIETARQNFGWLYSVAFTLLALSAVLAGLGRLVNPWLGYLAAAPALLSLAAFVEGRREGAISRREPMSLPALSMVGSAWFVLCLGVHALAAGIGAFDWILAGLGVLLTSAATYGLQLAMAPSANRK